MSSHIENVIPWKPGANLVWSMQDNKKYEMMVAWFDAVEAIKRAIDNAQ